MLFIIVLLPLLLGTAATGWLGARARGLTALLAWCRHRHQPAGLLLQQAPAVFAGQVVQEHWAWVPKSG
ncbi:MAG: hypothetical protein R3E42_00660 [Burkholderiaceae bacterium]